LLQSYVADLRRWAAGIAFGYGAAMAFLLAGTASLVVAAGVGVAAAFHVIEAKYGIEAAFAVVAGCFVVAGIVSLMLGSYLLKRPRPAIPRRERQMQALKRSVTAPALLRWMTHGEPGRRLGADATTQGLAGIAAILLIGWIGLSWRRRPSERARDRV
jgi:hypothetical protein